MKFTVPGKPVGYYASGKFPNWTRMKEYHEYKEAVGMYATQAGVSIPLDASKDNALFIITVAYFRNGIHCDPGNVQKGICDALFYRGKGKGKRKGGGDKYTGGLFLPPRYDKSNPRVEVEIIKVSDEFEAAEGLALFTDCEFMEI